MGTVPLASVEDRLQNGGRVAAQWALQILKMPAAVQLQEMGSIRSQRGRPPSDVLVQET